MPEKQTVERARADAGEGKSASAQAGEFVREEMHHPREGKHGAASPRQATAIGLSQARRAGAKLRIAAGQKCVCWDQGKGASRFQPRAERLDAPGVAEAVKSDESSARERGPVRSRKICSFKSGAIRCAPTRGCRTPPCRGKSQSHSESSLSFATRVLTRP